MDSFFITTGFYRGSILYGHSATLHVGRIAPLSQPAPNLLDSQDDGAMHLWRSQLDLVSFVHLVLTAISGIRPPGDESPFGG